jgi:hypothetical protein
MKLTSEQQQILRAVAGRPQDVFDLSDAVRRKPHRVFDDCAALKARRLVEWMYPEDEVAISDAGRAALAKDPSNG